MTKVTFYAAHDDAFIYGVGDTQEAAEAEYRAGIGDDQIIDSMPSISVTEMTAALFEQVEAEGGAICWDTDSQGRLCSEAEAN